MSKAAVARLEAGRAAVAADDRVIAHFLLRAADAIRARCVPGVRTCALPIWQGASAALDEGHAAIAHTRATGTSTRADHRRREGHVLARSEERRVGKECSYRVSPDH